MILYPLQLQGLSHCNTTLRRSHNKEDETICNTHCALQFRRFALLYCRFQNNTHWGGFCSGSRRMELSPEHQLHSRCSRGFATLSTLFPRNSTRYYLDTPRWLPYQCFPVHPSTVILLSTSCSSIYGQRPIQSHTNNVI